MHQFWRRVQKCSREVLYSGTPYPPFRATLWKAIIPCQRRGILRLMIRQDHDIGVKVARFASLHPYTPLPSLTFLLTGPLPPLAGRIHRAGQAGFSAALFVGFMLRVEELCRNQHHNVQEWCFVVGLFLYEHYASSSSPRGLLYINGLLGRRTRSCDSGEATME